MSGNQTQNTAEAQEITVDDLSNKIKETTNELNQLKSWLNNLSLEEQNDKLSDIENAILECSEDLATLEKDESSTISKTQLNTLKTQINTLTSAKESLQKQIEAQTKKEIDNLKWNIAQAQDNWENQEWDKKSWLGRQRSWLTSKEEWKNHTGKNILRLAWWVWIAAWIRKLWKRIFGGKDKKESWAEAWKSRKLLRKERREQRRKERRERRANRPWWQRFLIWWAIVGWTVIWWVQIYKNWNRITSWFKEKLWKSLTFDESIASVEAEVYNWIHKEDNFWKVNAHFEWIHFNKETSEIESFWEVTKIDYKNKAIYTPNGEGIWKVQFSDRKELIHAVNVVNFAKRALRWRATNPKPFTVSKVWWDIDFGWTKYIGASGSNFWTYLLWWAWAVGGGLLWWYFAWIKWLAIWTLGWWLAWYVWWSVIDNESTMNNICPTIKKWTNLHLFVNYLNDQKRADWTSLWESIWKQEKQPDNTTPIHLYLNKLIDEIEDSYWPEDSDKRNLIAEMDENDPTIYTIKSYHQTVKIKLEWCTAKPGEIWLDFSQITNMKILKYSEKDKWDLNIDFPHNEEWLTELIRTANLTNKIREDFGGKWSEQYPFYYTSSWWNWVTESLKMETWRTRRTPSWLTTILSKETCKNKFPTIFKDLEKFSQIWSFRRGVHQEDLHNQTLPNSDGKGSQYIKYLHQMRDGNNYYRKK